MGYNSSRLCGEICICNKGIMMKRMGGSQPGDQRKLIKFNWMSTFTNLNFCLSNWKLQTKSRALRTHGNINCKHWMLQNNLIMLTSWQGSLSVWWPARSQNWMKQHIRKTQKATVNMEREMFYPCMVLIQWCPLLLKQSCWRWHRTLKYLGPQGHWGKSPMKKFKQGLH